MIKITPTIECSNTAPFVLFGGINVLESEDLALRACEAYVRVTQKPVSYTHLTLPTIAAECRSRWSPDH